MVNVYCFKKSYEHPGMIGNIVAGTATTSIFSLQKRLP
jgi:hypothetical protein